MRRMYTQNKIKSLAAEEVKVVDVKVNGSSVVSDKVANISITTANDILDWDNIITVEDNSTVTVVNGKVYNTTDVIACTLNVPTTVSSFALIDNSSYSAGTIDIEFDNKNVGIKEFRTANVVAEAYVINKFYIIKSTRYSITKDSDYQNDIIAVYNNRYFDVNSRLIEE